MKYLVVLITFLLSTTVLFTDEIPKKTKMIIILNDHSLNMSFDLSLKKMINRYIVLKHNNNACYIEFQIGDDISFVEIYNSDMVGKITFNNKKVSRDLLQDILKLNSDEMDTYIQDRSINLIELEKYPFFGMKIEEIINNYFTQLPLRKKFPNIDTSISGRNLALTGIYNHAEPPKVIPELDESYYTKNIQSYRDVNYKMDKDKRFQYYLKVYCLMLGLLVIEDYESGSWSVFEYSFQQYENDFGDVLFNPIEAQNSGTKKK
jgi:hypothetical protein